jgi:UDP-2,3-diacylglucosamine pyrophosphatase LpxH
MLIFVSDIHLTDTLKGGAVSREDLFARFWGRIAGSRGDAPATLVFAGDLFDLVRSPRWFEGDARPYHAPSPVQQAITEQIVSSILEREAGFFRAIRERVEEGALDVRYLLGNHDRLLMHAPGARRAVWKALTGRDEDVEFHARAVFADHGVLAYHGHVTDFINHSPEGEGTIGDAIGSELIVRFPRKVREDVGLDREDLDDIDDVRPIYAVPAWVRQLTTERRVLRDVTKVWQELVESFLQNYFVRDWMKENKKAFRIDAGKRLKLLLELSTGKVMAKTHDHRMTQLYKLFQHAFDGKMVRGAAERLAEDDAKGLRFVVNGHSHFPSMVPLGRADGRDAAYFNTGTWRTVHQIAHHLGGRPTFLAYDAMTYLVFFPDGDRIGRDYEWWTGAMVARESHP